MSNAGTVLGVIVFFVIIFAIVMGISLIARKASHARVDQKNEMIRTSGGNKQRLSDRYKDLAAELYGSGPGTMAAASVGGDRVLVVSEDITNINTGGSNSENFGNFCPMCGRRNKGSAKFCSGCGFNMGVAE